MLLHHLTNPFKLLIKLQFTLTYQWNNKLNNATNLIIKKQSKLILILPHYTRELTIVGGIYSTVSDPVLLCLHKQTNTHIYTHTQHGAFVYLTNVKAVWQALACPFNSRESKSTYAQIHIARIIKNGIYLISWRPLSRFTMETWPWRYVFLWLNESWGWNDYQVQSKELN